MLILIWIVAGALLLVWSLLAWGLWALLTVDPAWVAALREQMATLPASELLERWLDSLLPNWERLLSATIGLLQALLRGVAGWLPWLIGIAWAVGVLLLGASAGLLHWAVSRHTAAPRRAGTSA